MGSFLIAHMGVRYSLLHYVLLILSSRFCNTATQSTQTLTDAIDTLSFVTELITAEGDTTRWLAMEHSKL